MILKEEQPVLQDILHHQAFPKEVLVKLKESRDMTHDEELRVNMDLDPLEKDSSPTIYLDGVFSPSTSTTPMTHSIWLAPL